MAYVEFEVFAQSQFTQKHSPWVFNFPKTFSHGFKVDFVANNRISLFDFPFSRSIIVFIEQCTMPAGALNSPLFRGQTHQLSPSLKFLRPIIHELKNHKPVCLLLFYRILRICTSQTPTCSVDQFHFFVHFYLMLICLLYSWDPPY